MSGFWNVCPHRDVSEVVDDQGQAICNACGSPVTVRLTAALFHRSVEAVRRDHGPYGRHTMRCVDTGEGWVCADGCTIRRPHAA